MFSGHAYWLYSVFFADFNVGISHLNVAFTACIWTDFDNQIIWGRSEMCTDVLAFNCLRYSKAQCTFWCSRRVWQTATAWVIL